ncbi:MAG: hypothetical protein SGPRY_011095, partial [Prymnesium sp.]
VVKFDEHSVVVYPDEVQKPPVGEGLNKRAIYTMHGVWPHNKGTQEYFFDAISAANFREKLQRKAEAISARFLSYSTSTGEWRLQVNHF